MRESVIDALFYLFDDLLDEEVASDIEEMASQLSQAGFTHDSIGRAISWFDGLSRLSKCRLRQSDHSPVLRVFSACETAYIDVDGQSYLLRLLRQGVLDNAVLEIVIESALALEEPLDDTMLRWVTAMIVLNVYGRVSNIQAFGLEEPTHAEQIAFLQ